jgi:hypothetical protein
VTKKITATVKQESSQTVTVEVRGDDLGSGPELLGYVEITAVPKGVRVEGYHGRDDSQADEQIILHGETRA